MIHSLYPLILGWLSFQIIRAQSVVTLTNVGENGDQTTVLTLASSANNGDAVPTVTSVTYLSYATQLTVSSSNVESLTLLSTELGGMNASSMASGSASTASSSGELTVIVGGSTGVVSSPTSDAATTQSSNTTASRTTSSSAAPTNTQACNNYPEFCSRRYSNITEVCAHNSPFAVHGNAFSNQELSVIDQLNDGIRMLQGQTHLENGTMYFCHTSCSYLNAGTVESYLRTVAGWVATHPYDVVTILLGNTDVVGVGNFTAPIQNSGIARYLYVPPKTPMFVEDWPTLSNMILTQKRVVMFMDYNANQNEVPYLLDEFSQIWESPFSPTDASFPCTVDRPPSLSRNQSLERMYIANHNLNQYVPLGDFLIPNVASINQTNAISGPSSLGAMSQECTADWGRPPNFLLVDFYNRGNGSVFEIAAMANNVTYNRRCCGVVKSSGTFSYTPSSIGLFLLALTAWFLGNS